MTMMENIYHKSRVVNSRTNYFASDTYYSLSLVQKKSKQQIIYQIQINLTYFTSSTNNLVSSHAFSDSYMEDGDQKLKQFIVQTYMGATMQLQSDKTM